MLKSLVNKVAGEIPTQMRLQHGCFPLNFARAFRSPMVAVSIDHKLPSDYLGLLVWLYKYNCFCKCLCKCGVLFGNDCWFLIFPYVFGNNHFFYEIRVTKIG